MRASWKLDRCRQAVERLSEAQLQWDVFSRELIAHLRPAVGFDGWCAALAGPATGLPATAVTENSPVAYFQRRFYQLEYQDPDVSTGEAATAGSRQVAVLSDVTGGDLARSRRWNELLRPDRPYRRHRRARAPAPARPSGPPAGRPAAEGGGVGGGVRFRRAYSSRT